jgi:polyferredoxin
MKSVKTIGLIIFIAGFAIFNTSCFWATYQLEPETIRQLISDERKANLFLSSADNMIRQPIPSVFVFVGRLTDVFRSINEEVIAEYAITADDVRAIAEANSDVFSTATLETIFDGKTAVGAFKEKAILEYSGWLEGRSFDSREDLENELTAIVDKINTYGVINAVGFDRYQVKDLKFSLTRASAISPVKDYPLLFLVLTYGLCIAGAMLYILPGLLTPAGIKNNGTYFSVMKNVGWLGILTGTWLILFYVVLYFYPEYMTTWTIMLDPLSQSLNGGVASRFFVYGFIYTLCILVMGIRMMIRYRHSRYHLIRTVSVMFFQTAFAFLLPEILIRLNKPYFDFKNIWPLDYTFFFDSRLNELTSSGNLGFFMLFWGIALIIIAVPVFVYFFGKRWYCSWVCGCGGLAETLGDPFRHLSNKTVKAWKVERWMVHGVLVFATVMTVGVLYTYFMKTSWVLFFDSYTLREIYGSFIGAGFAGVVGTGFYPLMGNRVWCRFGCPLAAYLGIMQRFKSRFRITTNGGQCISCGNCSAYCEMGIDVRWYAQRGQNIVRASCVGCGICSSVCPRGVLNLETKGENGRFGKPVLIGNNGVKLAD